jgi:hypothetical protein
LRAIAALAMVLATVPMGGPARAEGGDPAGRTLEVGGARIQVILPAGELDLEDGALLAWIAASARAVEAYQGSFPVPAVTVRVKAHEGRGVGCGTTRLAGSPGIEVSVGRETRAEDLGRDWVLDAKTLKMVDEKMTKPALGENHDVQPTPDGKFALLTLRTADTMGCDPEGKPTPDKKITDGTLALYDAGGKKLVGKSASVCFGCHKDMGKGDKNAILCGIAANFGK